MAGIAQVWLSEKELEALLLAAFSTSVKVSDQLTDGLRDKLLTAFNGVACAVPQTPAPAECLSCTGSVTEPDLEDGGW